MKKSVILKKVLKMTDNLKIKVSSGTQGVLGLSNINQKYPPTACYLLLGNKCDNSCSFCTQNSDNFSLSRIKWSEYDLYQIVKIIKKNEILFDRICIQTTNYKDLSKDLLTCLILLKNNLSIPVSLSTSITEPSFIQKAFESGIDNYNIPLDAATSSLFHLHKKRSWKDIWDTFNNFKNSSCKFSTHLIVGLGETEKEFYNALNKLNDLNITASLFAFTPLKNTPLEKKPPPDIQYYRRTQLLNFILTNNINIGHTLEKGKIRFKTTINELLKIKNINNVFSTLGCKGCNRPYFNERPGKVIYNFPRNIIKSQDLLAELTGIMEY